MTTEKQLLANQNNAQFSTGPTTVNGKLIVSNNAIKHGIFTKELILSSDIAQESEDDYQEILNNLLACLSPCNQMESLLVEKIAIDFWRLRRVIRFETGSIAQGIKSMIKEFYSFGVKTNEVIDEHIDYKQRLIAWNTSYIKCIANGEVSFDEPFWQGNDIQSDLLEDFYRIAKSIASLSRGEKDKVYSNSLDFQELRHLIAAYGYSESQIISNRLIELYSEENQHLEKDIQKLTEQKEKNNVSDRLTFMLGMIPVHEKTDKILKYERSLQKSIYQNLLMLKKIQGLL